MSSAGAAIEASYAFCREVVRRSRSNFCASFLLLPRPQRRAMHALYAFMRHTDDLGDSPLPVADRCAALHAWRAALDRALAGDGPDFRATEAGPSPSPPDSGLRMLPAVADMVRRFGVPPRHLYAVIDGQEMDLTVARYETFDALTDYCEHVASAVGLACIHIWGVHGEEACEGARKCGIAFQLTNILRDLREDLANGRLYLPLEDLRRCGYSVEDLAAGIADERFHRLMTFQIERARQFYREGDCLLSQLAPAARRTFGMMQAVYRQILEKIALRPEEVFRRRLRLTRCERLWIAVRWLLA